MTRRLLVIDDDPAIREVLVLTLSRVGGFAVTEAASGSAGVQAALDDPPDAILLDVMMPGMDGPTALQQLLADHRTADIPVVFLTAKVMRSEQERLKQLGARGVIAKPFDPLQLSAQVAAVLQW